MNGREGSAAMGGSLAEKARVAPGGIAGKGARGGEWAEPAEHAAGGGRAQAGVPRSSGGGEPAGSMPPRQESDRPTTRRAALPFRVGDAAARFARSGEVRSR